ncbi:MAG: hypothetical protein ACN793_01105 [Buchnera aphidicola (Eriosoma harunire)]
MDTTTKMNMLPWLIPYYKNIIQQHKKNKSHHAIILKSSQEIGINELIFNIGKWILCINKKNILYCNTCSSCILMNHNVHPDWYHIFETKNNTDNNIDSISNILNNAYKTPQQNINKIFFFSEIEQLNSNRIHLLLKLIEEPPKNTWFFFKKNNNYQLIDTLISRCISYNLLLPLEQDSLNWLKKKTNVTTTMCQTALKICEGSPITAQKLLSTSLWKQRINLFKQIKLSIKKKIFYPYFLFFLKLIVYKQFPGYLLYC